MFPLGLPDLITLQGANFSGIGSAYKMYRNDSAIRTNRHSAVKYQR